MNNFQVSTINFQFIKVAIVEDHIVVSDGFERLVNKSKNACVVGKAYNIDGCRELLKTVHVDVLLLDVGLPDGNGIDLCKEIKEKYPEIKILILSSYGEFFTINRAFDAGANGYLLKTCTQKELIDGIKEVSVGKQFLSDEVKKIIKQSDKQHLEFSRREMELLQLIADGYPLTEVAEKMGLEKNTIRNYRQKLNVKLDAHNTLQLVQKAKELKLI